MEFPDFETLVDLENIINKSLQCHAIVENIHFDGESVENLKNNIPSLMIKYQVFSSVVESIDVKVVVSSEVNLLHLPVGVLHPELQQMMQHWSPIQRLHPQLTLLLSSSFPQHVAGGGCTFAGVVGASSDPSVGTSPEDHAAGTDGLLRRLENPDCRAELTSWLEAALSSTSEDHSSQ
jgi:hypothetical protein